MTLPRRRPSEKAEQPARAGIQRHAGARGRARSRRPDRSQRRINKTRDTAVKTVWDARQATLDASITAAVKMKLLNDPSLSADSIDVETDSGVVILRGNVASSENVDHAVRLAANVEGVDSVLPRLHVLSEDRQTKQSLEVKNHA